MEVHSITVKQIISRVRQVFPDAPEAYIISLINDSLVDLGTYSQKAMSAKLDIVADQTFYDISDSGKDSSGNEMGINKIYRVDIMDDDGDYVRIPRVLDGEPLIYDMTSESAIKEPS
tara:strand:- start:85 stop:435 length:351 start_codon:yes stop_codon:yes gene_type:complete